MLPLALVVLAFGGPLALSALTGALGIGDDFPKVAAGVFAVVFGTLIVWAVMRVPESRPHVVAFLPLYVGLVVATAGSSLEGSKEFYGAAAQVAPVLFLAALIDGKALAVDLPHRVAAGQVLLYLFTAEVTSLLALLDPANRRWPGWCSAR